MYATVFLHLIRLGKMLILQYVSGSVEKCRLRENATDVNRFDAHSIYEVCKDAPWESKMR